MIKHPVRFNKKRYDKELVTKITELALRHDNKRSYKGAILHEGNVLDVDYQFGIGLVSFTVR